VASFVVGLDGTMVGIVRVGVTSGVGVVDGVVVVVADSISAIVIVVINTAKKHLIVIADKNNTDIILT